MFSLTKAQKYKKLTRSSSIYCHHSCGPWTKGFGADYQSTKILRVINVISSYFDGGINILQDINSSWKVFNVKELEVFKII